MPVEVESTSKTAVNARLSAASTRRLQNGNQIESSSDFYAELLKFQQPQYTQDIATPASVTEAKPTTSFDGESDSAVTTEADTNAEDDSPPDSEASNATETASANASQLNNPNRSIEQDFIASSEVDNSEDGTPTNQQADLLGTVGRSDKDAPGQGRQNRDQSQEVSSNRNDRSRELKKEKSRDSSNPSAASQRIEAKERPTAPQTTDETPINASTVEESRGLKKERSSETGDRSTVPTQSSNRSEEVLETEASLASRKALRTAQDNTATSTERPDPRSAIATPERTSKPEIASRTEASRLLNGRNVDAPTNTNQEGSRTRRRNDRSQTRTRGSETQREPTDRASANESSIVRRPESTFSPTFREPVFSQGMLHVSDSDAQLNALQPAAPASNTVQPSTASPTVVAMDVNSSTRSVAQSTSSASRVEQPLPTGAIASANGTASSIQTPGRPSSSAPASSGSRLSQHQETKLVQRVLRGMEQLADGGGQVRLRLHPPELGSLQMSLRIEGNTIFAEMQVETTTARDALMKNLPALKERLSEQGMQIEQFDVRADGTFDGGAAGTNSQGAQDNSNSGSSRQSSRYVDSLNNRLTVPGSTDEAEITRRWTRTHGALDFQA
jgi:flagellar hook-length control protein FliK